MTTLQQLLEATISPDTNIIKQVGSKHLSNTDDRPRPSSTHNSTRALLVFLPCTRFPALTKIKRYVLNQIFGDPS